MFQEIKNNPGILPEHVARLTTTSGSWRIINEIDLWPHFNKYEMLLEQIESLSLSCNYSCLDGKYFRDMTKRLKDSVSQVFQTTQALDDNHRPSRAIFEVFVPFIKLLSGTIHQNDAQRILNLIQIPQNNSEKAHELIKQHTEITSTKFAENYQNLLLIIENIYIMRAEIDHYKLMQHM